MGLGILEDRVMEHVPGPYMISADLESFSIDILQARLDISIIQTGLRSPEKARRP